MTTRNKFVDRTPGVSRNPRVKAFFKKTETWRDELAALREIILEGPLTEELKWGKPCYTFEERNVVILIPLKESCALMFPQGVLLKDPKGVLRQPGENSQAARWIKFTSVGEIVKRRSIVKAYIQEAVAAEKAGLKVKFKKTSEFKIPAELKTMLEATPALKAAFAALTPGRQRGYLLYFSAPKQAKTREERVEKCRRKILNGEGLNDR